MTKEEVNIILVKPENECNGADLHIRRCWDDNNAKSLFYITGIDFSHMFSEPPKNQSIPYPETKLIYI